MLRKSGIDALKALLELALAPDTWRSTKELAQAQDLPAPMLEQLLLRLRRAGLIEARRGRTGGYRLARPARAISLAEVLSGLGDGAAGQAGEQQTSPADQVTAALARRLARARQQALAQLSLEDLVFDLRSAEASVDEDSGLLVG